ncbi:type I toxin-antitoxin system SymE family toxin [Gilliamella sp. ESL0441]|nr:type I toxin-antitoxin system SymE family toxin [Gilliamella sp. ESL0441]
MHTGSHQLQQTPRHLKDNWLEAMGFKTGQVIIITVKRAN